MRGRVAIQEFDANILDGRVRKRIIESAFAAMAAKEELLCRSITLKQGNLQAGIGTQSLSIENNAKINTFWKEKNNEN